MESHDQKLEEMIDQMVERSLHKHVEKLFGNLSTEINTENGNSSIRQSGNGIVYVDNTGIAYAFMLFYQYLMKDELEDKDFKEIMNKLHETMEENRNTFMEAIHGLKN